MTESQVQNQGKEKWAEWPRDVTWGHSLAFSQFAADVSHMEDSRYRGLVEQQQNFTFKKSMILLSNKRPDGLKYKINISGRSSLLPVNGTLSLT